MDNFYKSIVDEAILAIMAFEVKSGKCVYCNQRARETLQAPTDASCDNVVLSQLMPESGQSGLHAFRTELLQHEGLYQDVLVKNLSDSIFIANIGVKKLKMDKKDIFLLMIQDVTLQKKLQREVLAKQNEIHKAYEELIRQNQQLKELDQAKDKFFAFTTHELRTPLAAMFASAEILKMKLYDNEQQMNEFIDMIYNEGLHMQELVDDFLDFSKVKAGRMDFYVEEHDATVLVRSLMKSFQGMAEEKKVSMQFNEPTSMCVCYFDELRLRQVLSNIINNAIKYNRESGVVTAWLEIKDGRACIFVKDTGQGIPTEQFTKVFDEFETLGQVATHHKGTGLGMPISKKLMEGMGGSISLTSDIGIGTTFWVEIPTTKVLSEELYQTRPSNKLDQAA